MSVALACGIMMNLTSTPRIPRVANNGVPLVFDDYYSRFRTAKLKGGEEELAQGSIVKRSDTYSIVYRVGDKQKWEVAGRTKKQAEKLLAKRIGELNTGVMPEETKVCFKDFAARWLSDYAKVSVKPSTYVSYEAIFRLHLIPAFGDLHLDRISGAHIQTFLAGKVSKGRLTPKSVANILIPLKEMFKHALHWGYVFRDPTIAIRRPRVEQEEMDFLNPEEISLLLQNVKPQHFTLLLTAILTGMRRGELLALQWGDIDWRSAQISVRRSLYKGTFVSPKSQNGVRRIIMSPTLQRHLEQYRFRTQRFDSDLVFCTDQGKPLDPDNIVKREFQPALDRAGLRRIRFHDLRHTFASLLIANGENIKFVQNQLGHASAKTTLDRYGHLFPGTQQEAAKRLDAAVFGNSVSKLLANPIFEENPPKKETSEVTITQRFDIGGGGRI